METANQRYRMLHAACWGVALAALLGGFVLLSHYDQTLARHLLEILKLLIDPATLLILAVIYFRKPVAIFIEAIFTEHLPRLMNRLDGISIAGANFSFSQARELIQGTTEEEFRQLVSALREHGHLPAGGDVDETADSNAAATDISASRHMHGDIAPESDDDAEAEADDSDANDSDAPLPEDELKPDEISAILAQIRAAATPPGHNGPA